MRDWFLRIPPSGFFWPRKASSSNIRANLSQLTNKKTVHLPIWQRRGERDRVGVLRVLCDGLLEDAEGQRAEDGVRLVGDGVGVVARVGGGHLAAALRIADLARRRVQLDVQVLRNSRNLS